MNMTNLVFRNVKKNLSDYMIYFLTLMISVSMFYAFNSIKSQPAIAFRSVRNFDYGIVGCGCNSSCFPDYICKSISAKTKEKGIGNLYIVGND